MPAAKEMYMGEKDLSQKQLEYYADVFADLVNALLYAGKEVLRESDLIPAPTETIYKDKTGQMHNQFHDISKYVIDDGRDGIKMQYVLENQTKKDKNMVLRKAGYQGAIYRGQVEQKQMYPVIGIVLYWGEGWWTYPDRLSRICADAGLSEEIQSYVDEVKLHIYHMCHLPDSVREHFHSDMRMIVDWLAQGEAYQPMVKELRHPEAVACMMSALSGDKRYEEIIKEAAEGKKEGEHMAVDGFLQKYIDKGLMQGRSEGIIIGREEACMEAIRRMLHNGKSAEQIMEFCGYTWEEVKKAQERV